MALPFFHVFAMMAGETSRWHGAPAVIIPRFVLDDATSLITDRADGDARC
jgi:hypothetical protein